MERLLTPQEMADYLSVKVRTLDNWAYLEKGPPYINVEGSRRYPELQVRDWLEARKVSHA